jgi:hypothetical protein
MSTHAIHLTTVQVAHHMYAHVPSNEFNSNTTADTCRLLLLNNGLVFLRFSFMLYKKDILHGTSERWRLPRLLLRKACLDIVYPATIRLSEATASEALVLANAC